VIKMGPAKEFLASLAKISKLNFQIWDTHEGLVFSADSNQHMAPPLEELEDFSKAIINQAKFHHVQSNGGEGLFGVPIKDGDLVVGSLVAFGSNSQGHSQFQTVAEPNSSAAAEMERFLSQVATLLEDRLTTQQEMEEMAEELTDNFEQLCFYARIAGRVRTIKFSGEMLKDLVADLMDTMRTDIAFARLPERPEYNSLLSTPAASKMISDQNVFIDTLIDSIPQNSPSLEENYFIINDSRTTPGYEEHAPEPYRFLAVKMRHNDNFYGWMGLVSFNLAEIFRRSELRLLNSMAEQIAVS